jgi:hypothetical protein
MAAMQTYHALASDEITFLRGYYGNADGGEGYFFWTDTLTPTTNYGTIITPTGAGRIGYWTRMFQDIIEVKWFGAKGDNATDDATAINRALVLANSQKSELYFTPGTYLINTRLSVNSDVIMKGDQRTSVIIKPVSGYAGGALYAQTGNNIVIQNMSFNGFQDDFEINRITNLTFDNVGVMNSSTTGKTGIYVKACKNVTIQNCFIDKSGTMGIVVDGGGSSVSNGVTTTYNNSSEDVLILNNNIKNTGDTAISIAANLGSVARVTVANNQISNAGKTAIDFHLNADPIGTIKLTLTDIVAANNVIFGWGVVSNGYAINFISANTTHIRNSAITGNTLRVGSTYNAQHKAYISVSLFDVGAITGNSCYGNITGGVMSSGINVDNANEVTLTGNIVELACQGVLSSDAVGGILLTASKSLSVTGNIVKNTGKSGINRPGIYLDQTTNTTINGNNCFDDRSTPSQSCGIEENLGGNCKDNFFGTNSCYGSITDLISGLPTPNKYSEYSIVYDSMPVQIGGTATFTIAKHTTFVILPDLSSTGPATINIESPVITNNLNYGTLTIWNQNTSSNKWSIATTSPGVILDPTGAAIAILDNDKVLTFHCYLSTTPTWVMGQLLPSCP